MKTKKPASNSKLRNSQPLRLLDINAVLGRIPLSHMTLLKRVQEGTFPAPFSMGAKTGWLESDVDNWISGLKRVSPHKRPGRPPPLPKLQPDV